MSEAGTGTDRPELTELEARRLDRIEQMNPPDDTAFRELACAVIFNVAKTFKAGGGRMNRTCYDFFRSVDYEFWAAMAGLNVDGETILKTLEKNDGVRRMSERVYPLWYG